MIITRKALPRRTFLRGPRGERRAAAARRHGPVDDRPRQVRRGSGAPPGLRLHAHGLRPAALDAARRGPADGAVAQPAVARAGRRSAHRDQQPRAEERVPRHARDVERVVPERRQGEVDREHGLPPGDDRRSGRRAAASASRRCCRRSNCRWTCCRWSGSATTATPACIRTTSRGRRRRRRFPPRRIRASSSSACSARAAARPIGAPRCSERASLLDSVRDDITRLQTKLGPEDRTRVGQYLETVREVERRIQKAEASTADEPLPDLDRPVGVPAAYADHAKLMFDLQVLAMQGDVTRVMTFQLARETSNRTYPEIGVADPHHPLTHHGNDPEKIAQHGQDQRLPRVAVRVLPREAEGDAGGRRVAARSRAVPLRQRHGQSERARSRQPADSGCRRRRRPAEGRRATSATRSRRRWRTCT